MLFYLNFTIFLCLVFFLLGLSQPKLRTRKLYWHQLSLVSLTIIFIQLALLFLPGSIQAANEKKAKLSSQIASAKVVSSSLRAQSKQLDYVESQLESFEASYSSSQSLAARQKSSQITSATTNKTSNDQTITTGQEGMIVGNQRSKIYHVPGQHGYSMSSKNAIYFHTEQEAIAAGYRKSLR